MVRFGPYISRGRRIGRAIRTLQARYRGRMVRRRGIGNNNRLTRLYARHRTRFTPVMPAGLRAARRARAGLYARSSKRY